MLHINLLIRMKGLNDSCMNRRYSYVIISFFMILILILLFIAGGSEILTAFGIEINAHNGRQQDERTQVMRHNRYDQPYGASVGLTASEDRRIESTPLDCGTALDRCMRNRDCSRAYASTGAFCNQSPSQDQSDQPCSESCREAMSLMVRTTEGTDFLFCDCGDTPICRFRRNEIRKCS